MKNGVLMCYIQDLLDCEKYNAEWNDVYTAYVIENYEEYLKYYAFAEYTNLVLNEDLIKREIVNNNVYRVYRECENIEILFLGSLDKIGNDYYSFEKGKIKFALCEFTM